MLKLSSRRLLGGSGDMPECITTRAITVMFPIREQNVSVTIAWL
jgi:hypothetical protein